MVQWWASDAIDARRRANQWRVVAGSLAACSAQHRVDQQRARARLGGHIGDHTDLEANGEGSREKERKRETV
jgi:hypothetical protein